MRDQDSRPDRTGGRRPRTPVFPRDFESVRDEHGHPEAPYQLERRSRQPQDDLRVLFSADISDEKRASIAADLAEDLSLPESSVDIDHIEEEDIPMKGEWKYQLIRETEETQPHHEESVT